MDLVVRVDDAGGFLCDAGESCGAYRTLDAAERIVVDPSVDPEITDIDFVSEFRAVITTQATSLESQAAEPAGFSFRRPTAEN